MRDETLENEIGIYRKIVTVNIINEDVEIVNKATKKLKIKVVDFNSPVDFKLFVVTPDSNLLQMTFEIMKHCNIGKRLCVVFLRYGKKHRSKFTDSELIIIENIENYLKSIKCNVFSNLKCSVEFLNQFYLTEDE